MLVSKAVEGYFYDKETTLSKNTIRNYKHMLRCLVTYLGDPDIERVSTDQLTDFIKYLQKEYIPNRPKNSPDQGKPLSPASIDNHWKATRSFFGWAHEALNINRPDLDMPRPRYSRPYVAALKEEEIRRILRACEFVTVERNGKKHIQRIPAAHRDKALILTLLDTGLRLGELLRIELQDIEFESGEIIVKPYSTGRKTRPRMVVVGSTSRRALWLYVARFENNYPDSRLFPMSQHAVRLMMKRLAKRAGIPKLYPHLLRHTFAIWFLRNGGDIFTLQRMLGHSTLEMVSYYLDIANADIANAHQKASAVDRWNAQKRL